jgi:ribosomal protein S8
MLKLIYNIIYLNKIGKKVIKVKLIKRNLALLRLLLKNDYILAFKIKYNYIYIYLKYSSFKDESVIKKVKKYTTSNKYLYISYLGLNNLIKKNVNSLYVLDSRYGVIDNSKALELNVGGRLLLKIN